jgi:hypothetical protein
VVARSTQAPPEANACWRTFSKSFFLRPDERRQDERFELVMVTLSCASTSESGSEPHSWALLIGALVLLPMLAVSSMTFRRIFLMMSAVVIPSNRGLALSSMPFFLVVAAPVRSLEG